MTMNLIAQQNETDCSPTAIANAICWANDWKFNGSIQTDILNRVVKLCKTDEDGTADDDFVIVLKKMGKRFGFVVNKIKVIKNKKDTQEVYNHIKHGGSVILSHIDMIDSELAWHHSFWFKISCTGCLMGANVIGGCEFYACPVEGLHSIIRITRAYGGGGINQPEAYFLTKVK